ncbi:MAG: hypothetical protein V1740_03430 [Candidatus Woesearchaeota archaeon]
MTTKWDNLWKTTHDEILSKYRSGSGDPVIKVMEDTLTIPQCMHIPTSLRTLSETMALTCRYNFTLDIGEKKAQEMIRDPVKRGYIEFAYGEGYWDEPSRMGECKLLWAFKDSEQEPGRIATISGRNVDLVDFPNTVFNLKEDICSEEEFKDYVERDRILRWYNGRVGDLISLIEGTGIK